MLIYTCQGKPTEKGNKMFYVYRAGDAESLMINPRTGDHLFFDMDTLQRTVEEDAKEEMYEDGDSIPYVLIDLKNKTFKTIRVYYVITYTTEIEIED